MVGEEEYFARVVPVLGEGLRRRVVSVDGISLLGRVVELLASCRLGAVRVRGSREPVGWPLALVTGSGSTPGCGSRPTSAGRRRPGALRILQDHVAWKNGFVPLRWKLRGSADLHLRARLVPAGHPGRIDWDESHMRIAMFVPEGDDVAWRDLSNTVARVARDLLMGRAPWPAGSTRIGHPLWPWAERQAAPRPGGMRRRDSHPQGPRPRISPALQTCARSREPSVGVPALPRCAPHVIVLGLGSVGSEVVRSLAPHAGRFTLVDGARVSVHNPHRQWFGTVDIGRLKADVLAARLARLDEGSAARAIARSLGPDDISFFEALLDEDRPDLVILATGTQADLPLAAVLQRRDIPHVVAYAYPRARFFEVSVIVPGMPCLGCYRGHLDRGPAAALPMTDEIGSILYAMPDGQGRDRAFTDLVAEPATAIETGRLADVVVRCARELLAAPDRRSPWILRMLEAGTGCLMGANVVEIRPDGEPAYGLTSPGQVVRLGLEDIGGVEANPVCRSCGRQLTAVTRYALPAVDAADADRGLLDAS